MTGRLRAALLLAVALVVTACGSTEVTSTDVCDAPVRPPLQEGSHLLGDTAPPVPYSSTPPTSGWHRSGRPPLPGVYGTQLPDPDVVAVLEQGGLVVAHGEPLTPQEDALAATLVAEVEGLVVTRYDLPADGRPVALVAWGVLQRCDVLDADAVVAFASGFGDRGPDH